MSDNLSPSLLVIDDDPLYHRILQQKLRGHQIYKSVAYSLSAEPVLEMIIEERQNADLLPDIIFLDLDMPGLNGRNFLHYFDLIHRSLAKWIDIIIISSSTEQADRSMSRSYSFVKGYFDKACGLDIAVHLAELIP
ncbi:response regulator [Mucilaginibacter sp. JRF]|uniref:response regulator n=1 Tax=Mucilaginibacter sp. JRF TaxID=2780088 RepID=UPI00187E58EC|nr:response regulator [Mucilaginibacter sp. JRF]MBE9586933.1 response regulator [Mucilaginibacter sp. JRF]